MRKIIWTFLFCLVAMSSHAATLHGYGDVERCWAEHGTTLEKWYVNCGGTVVGGEFLCAQEGGVLGDVAETLTPATAGTDVRCWCRMKIPYAGMYVFMKDVSYAGYGMCSFECSVACSMLWIGENCTEAGYDEDCVADWGGYGSFFNEEEQELFLSALFSIPEIPCEIGISKLMVSTGDFFQLYAEQYTEHALVVQYNDEKCYVKLESGVGNLNVNFNGEIYHAVN